MARLLSTKLFISCPNNELQPIMTILCHNQFQTEINQNISVFCCKAVATDGTMSHLRTEADN